MKILTFDFETIPDLALVPLLPEIVPNKTLKDPEKIAADISSKREALLDSMNLEPAYNIICCAGWCDYDTEKTGSILLKGEDQEADLLNQFWDLAAHYDHFVTFNGRQFDMRCLLLHGMKHKVRPTIDIDFGKYNRGNHTDIRPLLAGEGQFAKGKLGDFARLFLGDDKTEGIDGKLVAEYWAIGAYDMIQKYCEKDCMLTHRLFKAARTAGLVTF